MKIPLAPRHLRIKIRRISRTPLRLARSVRRLVRCVRGKALYSQPFAAIRAYFGRLLVPRVENRTRDGPTKPSPSTFTVAGGGAAQGRRRVVPEGFVAVYVGEEQQRFVIPIGYLQHPFMMSLMVEAEDTFGLDHRGPLALPCDVNEFELLQWLIERENLQCR